MGCRIKELLLYMYVWAHRVVRRIFVLYPPVAPRRKLWLVRLMDEWIYRWEDQRNYIKYKYFFLILKGVIRPQTNHFDLDESFTLIKESLWESTLLMRSAILCINSSVSTTVVYEGRMARSCCVTIEISVGISNTILESTSNSLNNSFGNCLI